MNKLVFLLLTFLLMINYQLQSQVKPGQDTIVTARAPDGATDTTDIIYQIAEEQASFPGGIEELYRYLSHNLKYPEEAREMELEGMVYVEFIVEKDGSITNVRVIHSVAHASLNAAAIEVVKEMPKWLPARQRGKPVRSIFVLPVQFKLSKDD